MSAHIGVVALVAVLWTEVFPSCRTRDPEEVGRGGGQPGADVEGHVGRRNLNAVAIHLVAGETRSARIGGGSPGKIDPTAARRRGRQSRWNRRSGRVLAARCRGADGGALGGGIPGVVVRRDPEK